MAALGSDPELRAVVVAARGPHFSVGLDLVAMSGLTGASGPDNGAPRSMAARARSARAEILRLQASVTPVADCPLPVIAAVHGYCIGGGVDLIAACDIRLASADALFSVREAKVAIVADLGSLQRLPAIIGQGHVAELAYTGKDITAARAESIGLVNQVSADAGRCAGRRPEPWPPRSPPTRRWPSRAPRPCWRPARAARWPRGWSTWPPGTPASWPPTTWPRR